MFTVLFTVLLFRIFRKIRLLCSLPFLPLLWCIQLFCFFKRCEEHTAAQRNPGHSGLPPLYWKEVTEPSGLHTVPTANRLSKHGPQIGRGLLKEMH